MTPWIGVGLALGLIGAASRRTHVVSRISEWLFTTA